MACNVTSLTSGNIKSLAKESNVNTEVDEDILSKIRRYTTELAHTNCPDTVYDYFDKQSGGRLDVANQKVTAMLDINEHMKRLAKFVGDQTGDGGSEMVDTLCLTLNGVYKTIIDIIEDTIKLVPQTFEKIDKLRKEIESTILNFGIEIKNCILDVLNAVQRKLNELGNSMLIDYSKLRVFMDGCPCAKEAIATLFGCDPNSSSSEIVACITEKYNLDVGDALDMINTFFNNVLKATVTMVYEALEEMVKYIFKKLMQPIRELLKWYCELLNKKINVDWLIKSVGPAECFFIYTRETKTVNGVSVSYYGMSIIDMLNTFKSWATCFDTICSFSDDLARDIKRFNEELRLNARYWKDPYTTDIFNACISSSLNLYRDDASTREIFVKSQKTSKNSLTDIYDAVKKVKKQNVVVYKPYNDVGAAEAMVMKPDPDSSTGSDAGNLTANKEFYDGIDDRIISLTKNIESGIVDESYYRILLSLRSWLQQFVKSPELLDALNHAEYMYTIKNTTGASSVDVADTTSFDPDAVDVDPFNEDVVSTYKQQDEPSSISTYSVKPTKGEYETLSSYYGRWYEANHEL